MPMQCHKPALPWPDIGPEIFILIVILSGDIICITLKFMSGVARWLVFKPKIPIWVNFRGSCNKTIYFVAIWFILRPFGIFRGHFVYFMVIWYIFTVFGMFYQEKSGNLVHVVQGSVHAGGGNAGQLLSAQTPGANPIYDRELQRRRCKKLRRHE
jgi:hypothetical protein